MSEVDTRTQQGVENRSRGPFLVSSPAELAAAREARGMSQFDVSQRIKLQVRQVAALEEGNWDLLPGRAFARGALRSYGKLIHADVAPLLDVIGTTDVTAQMPRHALSRGIGPVTDSVYERRQGRSGALLWVIGGLIAAGALIYHFGSGPGGMFNRDGDPAGSPASTMAGATSGTVTGLPAASARPGSGNAAGPGAATAPGDGQGLATSQSGVAAAQGATAAGPGVASGPGAAGIAAGAATGSVTGPAPGMAPMSATASTSSSSAASSASPAIASAGQPGAAGVAGEAASLTAGDGSSAAGAPPSAAAPSPAASTAASSAAPSSTAPSSTAPSSTAAPSAATPSAAASSAAASIPSSPGTIVLQPVEDSWVRVTDATGRKVHEALIPAGTTVTVDGKPPYKLRMGNARHLRLHYEGRTVKVPAPNEKNITLLELP